MIGFRLVSAAFYVWFWLENVTYFVQFTFLRQLHICATKTCLIWWKKTESMIRFRLRGNEEIEVGEKRLRKTEVRQRASWKLSDRKWKKCILSRAYLHNYTSQNAVCLTLKILQVNTNIHWFVVIVKIKK